MPYTIVMVTLFWRKIYDEYLIPWPNFVLILEPYVQLAIDSYTFQGVIPEVEVLACYLKTLSKLIVTSRIPSRHLN